MERDELSSTKASGEERDREKPFKVLCKDVSTKNLVLSSAPISDSFFAAVLCHFALISIAFC